MSSIKHEILTKSPGFRAGAHGPSRNTIEQYKTHAIKYGQWAKKEFRCRRFEELRDHIQDYADYLKKSGKRPATIHTYIAACCYAWDVPMEDIQKQGVTAITLYVAGGLRLSISVLTLAGKRPRDCMILLHGSVFDAMNILHYAAAIL